MWPGMTPAMKKRVLIRQSMFGPAIWGVVRGGGKRGEGGDGPALLRGEELGDISERKAKGELDWRRTEYVDKEDHKSFQHRVSNIFSNPIVFLSHLLVCSAAISKFICFNLYSKTTE